MSKKSSSYRQVLKTSSIIGGSSAINILIGLVRTKALALLLGSVGVGLAAISPDLVLLPNRFITCSLLIAMIIKDLENRSLKF